MTSSTAVTAEDRKRVIQAACQLRGMPFKMLLSKDIYPTAAQAGRSEQIIKAEKMGNICRLTIFQA